MSKFHSTVSRRTFMKGLGLGAAGLGAAAAAAPVFHDLDELMASPNSGLSYPWWVKERNYLDSTTETDWSILQPWDWAYKESLGYNNGFRNFPETPGDAAGWKADEDARAAFSAKRAAERARTDLELNSTRTAAIKRGAELRSHLKPTEGPSFMGYSVNAPETRHTGTPEENARTIRAAFHLYGFPRVGFLSLDSNVKKLYYPTRTRFEDVAEPYHDDDTGQDVIPNSCSSVIVATVLKSNEMSMYYGTWSGRPFGYNQSRLLLHRGQQFVKGLGYHALTGGMNVALGTVAGTNELGRIAHAVSPDLGARMVKQHIFATDLPLPTTNPIDAGIARFCKVCKKCATYCKEFATGNLSLEDETVWEGAGPHLGAWNRIGIKQYPNNWRREGGCSLCTRVCVFNHKSSASIHDVVGATLAITPIFNSFFATMDDTFGYGEQRDMLEWWNRDLATYPYDTMVGGGGMKHIR